MQNEVKLLPEFMHDLYSGAAYGELFILLQKLLIALLIGVLIGLEREFSNLKHEKSFAGIRTYPLISIFGFLGALISAFTSYWVFIAFFLAYSFFAALSYYETAKSGGIGITSEVASILVFILGALVFWNYILVAAIIAIVMAVLLSLKTQLHTFVEMVTGEDIYAILKMAIITIIILPLLPDQSFGPGNTINLQLIWYMIIFIAGISFIGYMLTKFVGYKKGITLTSLFGGLVSSTALTFSFSRKSKENEQLAAGFASGLILASAMVYPKVAIEVAVVNPPLLAYLWLPLLLICVAALVISFRLHKTMQEKEITGITLTNPFELKSALFFGLLFGVILFLSKMAQLWLGAGGSYLVAAVAGLTNIDAITLSMARHAQEGLPPRVAVNSILIALLANTVFKGAAAVLIGAPVFARLARRGFSWLALTVGLILVYLLFV